MCQKMVDKIGFEPMNSRRRIALQAIGINQTHPSVRDLGGTRTSYSVGLQVANDLSEFSDDLETCVRARAIVIVRHCSSLLSIQSKSVTWKLTLLTVLQTVFIHPPCVIYLLGRAYCGTSYHTE